VKPFLLLAIRAEDAAADNEYASFQTLSGLTEDGLRRSRLEQRALGDIDLRDWSGILLGGGPFNYTDPEDGKSPVQRRVEADLQRLLDQVADADFPFLGACYGIGSEPSRSPSPRRASATRCWPGCPARSTPSPATRRRSANCPAMPSCSPRRTAAPCRCSGSG
jgi:hypothetical protein